MDVLWLCAVPTENEVYKCYVATGKLFKKKIIIALQHHTYIKDYKKKTETYDI